MLYGTKLYPFKIAGPLPFEDLSGIFYYFKDDGHWLLVEATSVDEADEILSDRGLWAFADQSENGLYIAGVSRMVNMQRLAAKQKRLDIWDDGFEDTAYEE